MLSVFAVLSTLFFLAGVTAILAYCISLPNQLEHLPATGSFFDTITFIGMAMYAFEGQTMV